MTPMQQMQPPPQQPGWFKKNWPWLVGGGCLTMLLCCGGFGAVTYFGVTSAVKKSGPYIQAVAQIQSSQAAEDALGRPIDMGFMGDSSMKESNGQGTMEFTVKVSGPKGKGTVSAKAHQQGQSWVQDTLVLDLDSGQHLDLLATAPAGTVKDAPPAPDAPPDQDAPPADPADDVQPDQVKVGDDPMNKPLLPPDQQKP